MSYPPDSDSVGFSYNPYGSPQDDFSQQTGVVETDAPCRKCGYNQRGLPISGRCPECGTPVGYSLKGDFLRYSDPNYTGTLRSGITMIIAGAWCIIAAGVLGAVFGVAGQIQTVMVIAPVLGLLSAILMVVGAWQLTVPDPSGLGEERYGGVRKFIRIALILGIANHLLALVAQFGSLPPEAAMGVQLISIILQLVALAGQIAMLSYLSRLAMRIPSKDLSSRANFLMYALGFTMGILQLFSLLILFTGGRRGSSAMMGTGCFMGILGLLMLVFFIMYLVMLYNFGGRLKVVQAQARQTWS